MLISDLNTVLNKEVSVLRTSEWFSSIKNEIIEELKKGRSSINKELTYPQAVLLKREGLTITKLYDYYIVSWDKEFNGTPIVPEEDDGPEELH